MGEGLKDILATFPTNKKIIYGAGVHEWE